MTPKRSGGLKQEELMGKHWDGPEHSVLYQLFRRVEGVTDDLEERRQLKHGATKKHIAELSYIALQLKKLDLEKSQKR